MSDIDRILALPEVDTTQAPDLTKNFRRRGGGMNLREVQNRILYQAHKAQGLLGLVGVGEGKTLASFLLPHVFSSCSRPLLLVPASMREQCIHDWGMYGRHFLLPSTMFVRSYELLSSNSRLLSQIQPDIIIADEAHKLRNLSASRTKRVARYIKKASPKFVALSGTLTSTSLEDFSHLARWSLGEKSPIPTRKTYIMSWSQCLDRDGRPNLADKLSMKKLREKFGGSEREAFQSRLEKSQGVIISKNSGPPCSLVLNLSKPPVDEKISGFISKMQKTWTTPGGEELDSALAFVRAARQLACGFYYVWKWKDGIVDEDWLEARAKWNRSVRRTLERAGEGYDSPGLLARACERLLQGSPEKLPKYLVKAWVEWLPHKDKPLPPVAARWVSNSFIDHVAKLASQQTDPPIIWYGHQAVALRLARQTGFPIFGSGPEASERLLKVQRPEPIIASLASHSQGKNLQMFGNAIFAHPLSDGARYEQALGRHHRTGQKREEVYATIFDHKIFDKALVQAKKSAAYIQETTGMQQRLIYASYQKFDETIDTMSESA